MALSEQVARLEARLEAGEIERDTFEEELARLVGAVSGSSDVTQVDRPATQPGFGGGPTPHHIGAYELVELLGSGGMGAVYLAKHLLKPGLFAVKVPRYALLSQKGFGRRFKREASVGLRLSHPGIVRVHDLVIDGEWAAIVMEFVAGPNLETLIRNQGGPLPGDRVLDLMVQLLDAMDAAHAQGVVHRDLKPKNLIVRPDGRLQVTDFGVAWMTEDEETQAGSMVGTAPYMAPELYTGLRSVDLRADIYAIGMTLYKMLVGRLPFPSGMTQYQVLRAKEDGMVPIPDELPPAIQDVIRTAIHPDPDVRYSTCADMKVALLAAAGGGWDVPVRVTPQPAAKPPHRPWRYAAALMLLALVTGLGLLAWKMDAWTHITAIAWDRTTVPVATDRQEAPIPSGAHVTTADDGDETMDTLKGGLSEADPEGATDDEGADHRERAGDDWTVAGVAGGGLPPARISRRDVLEVHPAEPVRRAVPELRSDGDEPAQAEAAEPVALADSAEPGDPAEPRDPAEPVTAAPDPARGGTVVEIPLEPLPAPSTEEAGLLYLSSRPRTRVEVDGKDYGSTEQTSKGLVLQPGEYRVRFICESELCDGFTRRSGVKTLEVRQGVATRYLADFYSLNGR